MKTNRHNPKRMYILQFLTLAFTIVLLLVSIHWVGFGFREQMTIFFMITLFYPNLLSHIYRVYREEIFYPIMMTLVIIWTFLLYMVCYILGYIYEKNLGIVYLVCMIPLVVFALYLKHTKEWRSFYKSTTRSPFEEHVKEKARKIAEELELELNEMEQDQDNEELS
ncbi:MAG: hypothetical protein HXS44_15470 [Theionarchaea archaeon]|nr:hypothetical protein [Theionarchaea archaeon]